MDKRKLTKADIDKVRHIEGFPLGRDEDIIALSDAPYYTACPNPFIAEFIKEKASIKLQDDQYHREPFAADVSEGKNDAIYNAHSYHTKVPYKAIMRYILHYTNPGDIVFDGFCGSGMTGVAAQMCGADDAHLEASMIASEKGIQWGKRYAILSDLAPAATFIAQNHNLGFDYNLFVSEAERILTECENKYGWLYQTTPPQNADISFFSENETAIISNTVWSSVFICPNCGKDIVFYSEAVDQEGRVKSTFNCPHCHAEISKSKATRKEETIFDELLGTTITRACQVPVFKVFRYHGKKYEEPLNQHDYDVLAKLDNISLMSLNIPTEKMMFKDGKWGDIFRSGYHKGFTHAHHFYTKRNLLAISELYNSILTCSDERIRQVLLFALTGSMSRLNRTNKWLPSLKMAPGPITGMLYIPSLYPELNVFNGFRNKLDDIGKYYAATKFDDESAIITTQSSNHLPNIPIDSIDYIFVDPPFGDNIMYSESNFLWEAWLKVFTENSDEAIINTTQNKALPEYQQLMEQCFNEFFRILKPNHWITVEFHNSKNAVWNAIQQAILQAGFIIADVRTLDKKQGSFKQVTTTGAVKQDLVISAYKPTQQFRDNFVLKAGTEDTVWEFVRQHLSNVPVVVSTGGKIEIIAERQSFLLFDRMVAYHIMHGIAVPVDATSFYKGLDERFLKRDSMYYLPNQVNEYDMARATNEIESIQISMFVSNEKSAIGWLYQQLDVNSGDGPQTYQDLMPKFMQELKAVDKREKMPELSVILEENFLKDEDGKWYIPDLTKSGDIAKLREKNLLKEFQEYLNSKGKLKVFRSEAIRAGFAKLWKDKDYAAIVTMANRLPEETIQEDQNLLMYYDISLSRV